jgi:hypothetical protein
VLTAHGKPQLDEDDARVRPHFLQRGHLLKELVDLGRRREAHHLLHARSIIVRTVKDDDLPAGRKVVDVALEVP